MGLIMQQKPLFFADLLLHKQQHRDKSLYKLKKEPQVSKILQFMIMSIAREQPLQVVSRIEIVGNLAARNNAS